MMLLLADYQPNPPYPYPIHYRHISALLGSHWPLNNHDTIKPVE